MSSLTRSSVRKQLRNRRRTLDECERRDAALALLRVAAASRAFRNSRHVAFYLPNDGEQDVLPLLERGWALNKRCYLPVLDPLKPPRLRFLPYQPGDRLDENRFGIPEPRRGARERISAASLDLILLPLVAFDDSGNRLGMGGGFYDRTLGFLLRRRFWRRPLCYGVGFEFQRVDGIEAAPWDVPLDGCLTEIRLHRFDDRQGRSR
jgi:5-formyltetrahydrofolate cyclo-ligase